MVAKDIEGLGTTEMPLRKRRQFTCVLIILGTIATTAVAVVMILLVLNGGG